MLVGSGILNAPVAACGRIVLLAVPALEVSWKALQLCLLDKESSATATAANDLSEFAG